MKAQARSATNERQHQDYEKLKERTAVYAAILQDLPYFVVRWHPDGTVRYANKPLLHFLGAKRDDLEGSSLWGWMSRPDAQALQREVDTCTPENPITTFERTIHIGDGYPRWLEWHLHVFFDAQGNPQQIQGIGDEVTKRHQAESSQKRLTAILEATPDFVGIVDPYGNLLYHNQGAARMLGRGSEEVTAQYHVRASHPDWAEQKIFAEGFPVARRDGFWRGETALLTAESRELPVSQTILAHFGQTGEVSHFSTIMRDISAQKATQERLRQQFSRAVEVFSNLLQLRCEQEARHARRVAQTAQAICRHLSLDQKTSESVYHAALLHDIGKLGMPDRLIAHPFATLSSQDRQRVREHAALGEAALMSLEPLDEAADHIRSHHEYLDGSGYPDGLRGTEISLGTRILTAANDLDNLRRGRLFVNRQETDEALAYLYEHTGVFYDEKVVRSLWLVAGYGDPAECEEEGAQQGYEAPPRPSKQDSPAAVGIPESEPREALILEESEPEPPMAEAEPTPPQTLGTGQLRDGMTLAEDLYSHDGLLILTTGIAIDERTIQKLRKFETRVGRALSVAVYPVEAA